MAVIDDVRELLGVELLDELDPQPIIDDRFEHDCQACGEEGTNDHPVYRTRVNDLDGRGFTRLCVECLAGLAAHAKRGL